MLSSKQTIGKNRFPCRDIRTPIAQILQKGPLPPFEFPQPVMPPA
jgi:hypothetical protein